MVVSSFMNTLMKLPIVKSIEDINNLRILYDMTEAAVRISDSIGTEPAGYGTFITPILMAKSLEE